MATKSSIDFGSIVLGKIYVARIGSPEYENAREVERMRLQVMAGKRLAREAERQRIRVGREARTRVHFEALREKRAEEYHAELQRAEAGRQYQRHLERHRAEKLRIRELAQQENQIRDPEQYQQVLEGGRQADVAALTLRAESLEQGLVDSWLRLEDMTPLERDLLRPAGFSARELDQGQVLLTTGEVEGLEQDPLRPGLLSEQEFIHAQRSQESGEMVGLEGELLRDGGLAVLEQHQDHDQDSLPQQCEEGAELSEQELQQRRERRHYTGPYFGV